MASSNTTIDMRQVLSLIEVRTHYYNLLRQLFLSEPTEQLLLEIKESMIFKEFPFQDSNPLLQKGCMLAAEAMESYDSRRKQDFEDLHWDYTRMFVGPYELPAPPWASAYSGDGRLLFQNETQQIRKAYAKYGFQLKNFGSEAEDHIGYELDFMYRLTKETASLLEREEFGKAQSCIRDQIIFIEQHLFSWIPSFRKEMETAAHMPFYKGVAAVLEGALQLDRLLLNELSEFLLLSVNTKTEVTEDV
ncbi:TorD/DmsD family molecular chaperone [Salipaludibacillus aurantiacus]|uniref:Chaperone TorD involved in molybdoenzyme TorA maturation n=1 Tax=Salipaludibacillus aurantiacus TaxID=1601833 RepID=A0A1H9W0H5_9BACI|nr:molecular chaperone TorD family protein [Salipaludibacillus aurantiacus]SES27279.1 chaperone TorD involved in molybdoenzyme TorA maturation [Salipaludibacillus aurantiacus]